MITTSAAEKPQILIVEDDLDLSDMLVAFFDNQGYLVNRAAWGEDALRMSLDRVPDLVVLDVRLPDIDGYEVCRRLRGNRKTQDVPIIFLTEKRDRVDKLTGLELGVVDYITKPFDIQELRLRVRNSLRRADQHSLMNPVTNLPEGQLVEEKLRELLLTTHPWALLYVGISGLDKFRDSFGFVAADDVLRGVVLMMNNALREQGTSNDTIGHLDPHTFVIITDVDHVVVIRERIEGRIRRSMDLFQPAKDAELSDKQDTSDRLHLSVGQLLNSEGDYDDLEALKVALASHATVKE